MVGGAGYVGNVLVRRLLAAGHRVRVLDSLLFDHGAAIAARLRGPGFCVRPRRPALGRGRSRAALEGVTDVVLLAALVGDPICKKYPELARERQRRRRRHRARRRRRGAGSTASCSPRPAATTGCGDGRAGDRGVRAGAALALRRDQGRVRAADPRSRRRRLDFCADGAADRDRLRALAADALRPDDLGVHAHARDRAGAASSTTPTPGGPTATSPTSRRAIMTVLEADADAVARRGLQRRPRGRELHQAHGRRGGPGASRRRGRGRATTEGGVDPRNYRVSFDKIRGRLGFEPQHARPATPSAA